jgi:hypothetical protein
MSKPERSLRGRGRVAVARPLIRKHWLPLAVIGTAVLAVIAGVLAVGQAAPTSHRAPPAVGMVQRGIPGYYVALDSMGRPIGEPLSKATVRVTATGAVIARISAPRPYLGFIAVTGAANDRTFVLLAHARTNPFTGQIPERFFLLRIDPDAPSATARARLTALPARDIPGGQNASDLMNGEEVATMALSPDGRSLATILTVGNLNRLYVENLATGTTRSWVWNGCGGCDPIALSNPVMGLAIGAPALSWASDGSSVVFTFMDNHPSISYQLRLIHLSAQGSNILPSSTPFAFNAPVTPWRQAVMTSDGKTVLMAFWTPAGYNPPGSLSLVRISTVTGQVATINTLPMTPGYTAVVADTILWTNDNGSTVLIADARPGRTLGVYRGSKYTPLPWPADAVTAAW